MRTTVFILALALRIAAIEWSGAERTTFGDAGDYMAAAGALCAGHGYPDRGNLPFFRAPGLPFFIAGATACHPHSLRAIKYALAVCDAATCALIASLALLLFDGRRRIGWLAGIGAALDPLFIAGVCDVRSEPLFMLLLVLSIHELLRDRAAASGISLTLAALTRPAALLCAPLFALYASCHPERERGVWRGGRRANVGPARSPLILGATLLVVFFVTLAPWTIRNAVHFHRLILVNDAGGFNFWRGFHPETVALTNMGDRDAYRRAAEHFENVTIAKTAARHPNWTREGLDNIRRDPAAAIAFLGEKAWLYWRPWLNPQEYPPWIVIASGIGITLLYLLGGIGIARHELRRPILIFFIVMWLAHLPYQIVMRFRIPFVDPLLIAFAAATVVRGTARADEGRTDRSASTARP